MTRQSYAPAAALLLGLSAVVLGACGRTPTGPSYAAQAQEPGASVPARVAATTPVADAAAAPLSPREEELVARERELREQQEALRREREQLAAERARAGAATIRSGTAFDADQTAVPAPGARASSMIQKVPSAPIVVPEGTPLQVELAANVNPRVARVGDRIEGRLAEDLVVDDRRAAVAGATVSGKVTELVSGSEGIGGAATLELTFEALQAANGATVPVVARYVEQGDETGRTGGEVKLRAGTVITVPTQTSFSIY